MGRALNSIRGGGARMFSGIRTSNFGSLFMLACMIAVSVSIVSMIIFACVRQDNRKQNTKKGKKIFRDRRLAGDGGGGCGGGCGGGVVGGGGGGGI